MHSNIHPVEAEELMTYLDGEMPVERAAATAAHLQECRECQIVAAEFKSVSESMTTWEVEPVEPQTGPAVVAALDEREARADSGGPSNRVGGLRSRRFRPWLGGAFVGAAAALLMAFSLSHNLSRGEQPRAIVVKRADPSHAEGAAPTADLSGGFRDRLPATALMKLNESERAALAQRQQESELSSNLEKSPMPPSRGDTHGVPAVSPPMILRTAQLTVVTQNLDEARTSMDQIVQRYNGYAGDLTVSAPSDGARRLTANLRVPATQMDAAMAELKKLGRVESESQSGQDVTAQYVDLEARLSNARNTEQRLLDLLRQRTGKLSDVLEVETELGRVREEVERMEGERRLLSKQVEYSTIAATVTEEYKAPARAVPESTGTRFRNAAVDGYQSLVNFVIDVALFLLSNGLLLLLWAGILFFPARWAWRRMRAQ
jgi:hypothetical protein